MGDMSYSDELYIASLSNLIASSISLFCTVLVVFAYIKFNEFQTFSLKLYSLMILSDALQSLAWFFIPQTLTSGSIDNNWQCKASAFLLQFGQLSSAFWGVMISQAIYSAIVKGHIEQSSLLKKYFIITYGLSAVISSVPFTNSTYGPVEYFCWIQIDSKDQIASSQLRMCLFYLPLWVLFLIQIVYYFKVDGFEKRIAEGNNLKHKTHRKFISYTLIFLITWIAPTILRTLNMVGVSSSKVFPLAVIAIVSSRLHGFMCFLLYLFNRKIMKIVWSYILSIRASRLGSQANQSAFDLSNIVKRSQKALYRSTDEQSMSPPKTRIQSATTTEKLDSSGNSNNNSTSNNNNQQEDFDYDNIKDRDLSFISIEM